MWYRTSSYKGPKHVYQFCAPCGNTYTCVKICVVKWAQKDDYHEHVHLNIGMWLGLGNNWMHKLRKCRRGSNISILEHPQRYIGSTWKYTLPLRLIW